MARHTTKSPAVIASILGELGTLLVHGGLLMSRGLLVLMGRIGNLGLLVLMGRIGDLGLLVLNGRIGNLGLLVLNGRIGNLGLLVLMGRNRGRCVPEPLADDTGQDRHVVPVASYRRGSRAGRVLVPRRRLFPPEKVCCCRGLVACLRLPSFITAVVPLLSLASRRWSFARPSHGMGLLPPPALHRVHILRALSHNFDDAAAEIAHLVDILGSEGGSDGRAVVHPPLQFELMSTLVNEGGGGGGEGG